MGPAQERCDVVFMPICQASGLHKVHPTWAGTFVLAALSLLFPRLHIVLLDSDCVPVTLFEVEDLWQEAQRLRPNGQQLCWGNEPRLTGSGSWPTLPN